MDIAELKASIEKHLSEVGNEAEGALHKFADWIEGKQTEAAKEQAAITLLVGMGYTVTKQ